MAERWKIYLTIAFIGLGATPISMVAAKIDVPVWALIAGHCGATIAGFICAELGRGGQTMTSKFSIDNRELLQRISSGEAVVGIDFGNLIVRELAAFRLAAMDSEPDCKERKLFCSTDTTRMRKTISVSAGTEDAPLYRHAQPAPVVQCPFPCGWDNLNKLAIQDAELVARGLVEGELTTEAHRQAAISNNDRLLKVISSCRAAMLQELKKSAGTEAICRSDENVQVLHTKSPAQSDCCPAQNHVSPEQNGDTPAQIQGWIQVSEQMPPSRHEVLVGRWWGEKPRWCCKWATYIPGHPDAQSSGWLIPGASWTPTHWMPLPAAPKEVKGE